MIVHPIPNVFIFFVNFFVFDLKEENKIGKLGFVNWGRMTKKLVQP